MYDNKLVIELFSAATIIANYINDNGDCGGGRIYRKGDAGCGMQSPHPASRIPHSSLS